MEQKHIICPFLCHIPKALLLQIVLGPVPTNKFLKKEGMIGTGALEPKSFILLCTKFLQSKFNYETR